MDDPLFIKQLDRLKQPHFLLLYWAAQAEIRSIKYNITNAFDDLKDAHITRTKQSVVACVDVLEALCLIDVKDENNRKNIYVTDNGAKALEYLVQNKKNMKTLKSRFMEVSK